VLLKVDADGPNWSDAQAAEAFSCAPRTVFTLRQRCVEQGLEVALERKQRGRPPPHAPILDSEKEARLIRLANSEPPLGHARWTLRLLAAELVALKVVDSISAPTVMRALRKTGGNHIDEPTGRSRSGSS